ncbi:MAG TPA: DNRLRE domain-containing protein, partial [Anaerolineae bacterium]|nr:DNRLRE domain-containing protein [Anaerolineae bacterium]
WPWLYDVEMVDIMNGHAAANPYMFYTFDGGQTWQESSVVGNTANVEIAMASQYEGWTAQRNLGHRFTTSAGKHWNRFMPYDEHQGLFFFGVETLDVNQDGGLDMGWLVGCSWNRPEERCYPNTGVVFFAQGNEDPGYAQPLPPDTPPLYTITMLDSRRGWIGGEEGVLLYTDTGGATWRRVDVATSALITDIAFYKTKIGFATTYAGEILRFRGPGRNLSGFTQSTTIQVDGETWDWHYGGALYLDVANAGAVQGDEPYPQPEQLSANFYARWTGEMLYLMAEIADDVVGAEDGVWFALDGLNDEIWGNEGDLLLHLRADGEFDAGSPEANAAIAHAVRTNETGWVLELGIPVAWLGRNAFVQGDQMGLNIQVDDVDSTDGGHTLLLEDRQLLGNPAIWGEIQLVGNTFLLQNGVREYQGATDTYLSIWNEDGWTPHGDDESLIVRYTSGRAFNNTLIRFEMPAWLHQDATVTDARLGLHVVMGVADPNFKIAAYRLLKPWNPETAVWYRSDTDIPWGKPGAMQPGVDFDPQPLDVVTVPENPRNLWLEWDISDAVTYWGEHPDENYGILLMGGEARRDITVYSSDYNGDIMLRPKLQVDFILNPRPTPTPTPTPQPEKLYMPLIRR